MYKVFSSPIGRGSLPIGINHLNVIIKSNGQQERRCASTNYYEVLRVTKDSSDKEIRESFIKLSKQYHPDHSKVDGSAAMFQSIMEAYRVLSKPETRKYYDNELSARPVYARSGFATVGEAQEYENYRRQTHPGAGFDDAYYGIDGMKKKSNSRIVWAILGFAAVGVLLQAIAIRTSFTFERKQLDQISIRASKIHSEIRAEAVKHDRSDQLDRVLANLKKT